MHPLVALMRRYCIDYTNSHDQSWYPELFEEDYVIHINGHDLVRDASYGPATRQLFDAAPGLGLVVHELVLDGDRLCMRFSEHAAMPAADGSRRLAAWQGIGLYKWNGTRLTENFVEQDFLGRRAQERGAPPHVLEAPHIDPWMTTIPVPGDPTAEAAALDFMQRGDLHRANRTFIDGGQDETAPPLVVGPQDVLVNDVFSAGRRVAVHLTVNGPYLGGISEIDDSAIGRASSLPVAALVDVAADGTIDEVRAVTGRDAVRVALRTPR